jgi:(p)ppGpp synthase/HD superfamily hydrolase
VLDARPKIYDDEGSMSTLERAISIAAEAHAGQADKAGERYILHPLRVMLALSTDDERIVGVLHDVVEDCAGWTFERLREEGFSEVVIEGIVAVTRQPAEDYFAFVRRAGQHPLGRKVKLADLRDNSNLARIADPSEADRKRLQRYQRAISLLEEAGG